MKFFYNIYCYIKQCISKIYFRNNTKCDNFFECDNNIYFDDDSGHTVFEYVFSPIYNEDKLNEKNENLNNKL
jgi:hypothetical protein